MWERDTRRDVALAARGWVVLPFSHRRPTREPDACRREALQVCAARRAVVVERWWSSGDVRPGRVVQPERATHAHG